MLNIVLHIVDRVGRLHFEGDGFAGQRLDENLHAAKEAEDEIKGELQERLER